MGLLSEKAIAISGAGAGLGRAYAEAMALEGGRIFALDIDEAGLVETQSRITTTGGEIVARPGSIGSWNGGIELVEGCLEAFGQIDVLVNNAGNLRQDEVWDLKEQDVDDLYAVLCKGVIAAGHRASLAMKERRSGVILNVTSRAAYGSYGRGVYAGFKAAVASLTYTWALELAPFDVRVNAISPSANTAMMAANIRFPVGGMGVVSGPRPRRTGGAAEVAPLAVFLASDEAAGITGQVIALGGDLLALVAHPKDIRSTFKPGGWSVADLITYFRTTAGGELEPVGIGSTTYPWPDGLPATRQKP